MTTNRKIDKLQEELQARLDHLNSIELSKTSLEHFAKFALKIRPKMGPLVPFEFNPAQRKLHQIAEEQRRKTGRVRIIVLKARQLGISSYIAARLFHRVINEPALRAFICAHEVRASKNLY